MPKASDNIKIYRNPNGPVVSTVNRRVLEQDGLTFKDIDGTGTLSPVNDWRNSPAERAAAYVKTLSVKEKIAQLFISDWRMAKYPITGPMADLYKDIEKKTDETGILDEGEFRGKTIFGEQYLPGTSPLLKDWFNRHVILRANATPADLADWMNQADAVCEECEHFIPVAAASNSRNENGELVFGMNDAGGVLATWPGTLGIAAAVKGSKIDLVDKFADTIRREWNACGLRKGYMYMADAVTDPRWQRTYGTFGEDPALISEIMAHIIPRIQGSDHVDANGKPMADTHTETTLHGGKRLAEIAASVHANGGKVITNVNITLAWQLGNVEPLCDVLLAGFDTYRSATLDVIFGCFAPTGKLPLTLPRGDAVLAVNADGVCISPNDVPGYDKDRYMPDSLKDENGKAYAYRDAAGNYYEYGFGLEG